MLLIHFLASFWRVYFTNNPANYQTLTPVSNFIDLTRWLQAQLAVFSLWHLMNLPSQKEVCHLVLAPDALPHCVPPCHRAKICPQISVAARSTMFPPPLNPVLSLSHVVVLLFLLCILAPFTQGVSPSSIVSSQTDRPSGTICRFPSADAQLDCSQSF